MDTNVYSCSISQNGLNLPNHESSWVSPSLTTAKQRSTKSVLFFIYRGIPSGYSSLLALHLSGTPSQKTGTRTPSCLLLDNRLYILLDYLLNTDSRIILTVKAIISLANTWEVCFPAWFGNQLTSLFRHKFHLSHRLHVRQRILQKCV